MHVVLEGIAKDKVKLNIAQEKKQKLREETSHLTEIFIQTEK